MSSPILRYWELEAVVPFDLGAPESAARRAFLEGGPWQTCPLCREQSGSWDWLEAHILACTDGETGGASAPWQARWCPACSDEMDDGHDPDNCIDERAAG